MHIDFSLVLVLATLFSGVVWALDRWVLRRQRAAVQAEGKKAEPGLVVEYSVSFFPVLALVLVLRSFLYEPFQIPSGSMLPTLKIGDFILVNKYNYGVRLPVIHTEVIPVGRPELGDVAVFRYPLDPRLNYIKRVVGVPGDRIAYRNKELIVNGLPVERQLLERHPREAPSEWLWQEQLGEVSHQVYNFPERYYDFPEVEVPEGFYLVMGDNRDHSNDSRFWCEGQPHAEQGCLIIPEYFNQRGEPLVMGFVPEEALVGQAVAVWMHWTGFFNLPSFRDVRLIK